MAGRGPATVFVDDLPRVVGNAWSWQHVREALGVQVEFGLAVETTAGLAGLLKPGETSMARFQQEWEFESGQRYVSLTREQMSTMVTWQERDEIELITDDEEPDPADWWK